MYWVLYTFVQLCMNETPFYPDGLITILYLIFAFITYTLIPVIASYKKQLNFKRSDTVLLALNTFISSVILYSVFYAFRLDKLTGLLTAIFAIIYTALGRFIEKFMPKEKTTKSLFYITAVTFVALIIPFQFDIMWLSLGWLIEGVALLSYGIFKEIKGFKKSGIVITSLCFMSFLLFDMSEYPDNLFTFKYFSITAGSIIILASLIYKKNIESTRTKLFKYLSVINLWFFSIYIVTNEFKKVLLNTLSDSNNFNIDYLITATVIVISFVFAYAIQRIAVIRDKITKNISIIIYAIALVILFFLNFTSPIEGSFSEVPLSISITGTFLLVLISLLSIFALRDFVLTLVLDKMFGVEWYPFIIFFLFRGDTYTELDIPIQFRF